MKISDIEFFLVDAAGAAERSLVVRLCVASGVEGWGEAPSRWRSGELAARRDALLPTLADRSVFDIEELCELDALADSRLRLAVEMASWDTIGRICRQPLCRLWGGEYRVRTPLAIRLPRREVKQTAQQARELADQGFSTQILTASGDIDADAARVEAVRQATGGRTKLRLDGQRLFELDEARELCARLRGDSVEQLLDPLATMDFDEAAALARQTHVPLCIGHGVWGPSDVLALARLRAVEQVAIHLPQVGALWATLKCATVADAAQLRPTLSGGAGIGLALAAMLHLAAAAPALGASHESDYEQLHEQLLCEPIPVSDGMAQTPLGPGLGVEVDRARLEAAQAS